MFQYKELKRLFPLLVFFLCYSLLFFLWVKTFFYTLPFLLGLLLAILLQPILAFFEKKLHIPHTAAALSATLIVLTILFSVIAFLSVFAVQEITAFLVRASSGGFPEFSQPVTRFFTWLGNFFGNFSLDFLEKNQEELLAMAQNSMDLIVAFLGTVLGVITSLPTVVTMCVVTAFSTFFLSRDLLKLKVWFRGIVSDGAAFHLKTAVENSSGTGRKYLFSYLVLYFITFCETYIILSVLKLPYPLITSFITMIADLLPVLGPGIVFTPLALYRLLTGAYSQALGLFLGWLLITCIRQVAEPKLVSSTTKVHPLAMLAAVYFSLVAQSIWVLFYVMGFFLLYSAFRETGALPAFSKAKTLKPS